MDIQVAIMACHGGAITFQEPEVALEFLKMLMGLIKPEQFVSFIKEFSNSDDGAMKLTQTLIARCFGVAS